MRKHSIPGQTSESLIYSAPHIDAHCGVPCVLEGIAADEHEVPVECEGRKSLTQYILTAATALDSRSLYRTDVVPSQSIRMARWVQTM